MAKSVYFGVGKKKKKKKKTQGDKIGWWALCQVSVKKQVGRGGTKKNLSVITSV